MGFIPALCHIHSGVQGDEIWASAFNSVLVTLILCVAVGSLQMLTLQSHVGHLTTEGRRESSAWNHMLSRPHSTQEKHGQVLSK